MTAPAKPDTLINAYVEEVVRRLPMRQRSDVGFELRALLAESLRERAEDAGRAPDEAMTLDLLRGFGKPDDVASRYDTAAAVIIPAAQARSFLAVSLVGLALQWAVSLPPALAGGASQIGVWWVTGGLGALWWPGFLVIVAMIAALVRRRWPAGDWSPLTLDRDRINRPVFSFGILAALAGIGIWIACIWVSATSSGRVAQLFVFSDNFLATRAPVVVLFWTVSIALLVVVLIEGRWRQLTRRLQLASDVASLALLAWFLVGGPIFVAAKTDTTAKGIIGLLVLILTVSLGVRLWRNRGHIRPPQTLSPPAA